MLYIVFDTCGHIAIFNRRGMERFETLLALFQNQILFPIFTYWFFLSLPFRLTYLPDITVMSHCSSLEKSREKIKYMHFKNRSILSGFVHFLMNMNFLINMFYSV